MPGVRHKTQSLAMDLIDAISEQIRGGAIRRGEKLPTELAIIQKFGVSRTVVREAIAGLRSSGLVTTKHGIGTFVLDAPLPVVFRVEPGSIPTVPDILAVLELRMGLESEAAALAASRRTDAQLQDLRRALDELQEAQRSASNTAEKDFQFHLSVAEASGNRYFAEVLTHFGTASIPRTRVNLTQSAEDQATYESVLRREHEQIYGAVLCADPKLAAKFMRAHLSNSRDRFRKAQDQAVQPQHA